MAASHTGTKRPHPSDDHERRDRDKDQPRDWRDAFFDDRDRSPRGSSSREGYRDRDRDADRHRDDDRRRDSRRDDKRDDRRGLSYRERDRERDHVGFPSRYGDRDRRNDHSRRDDREEGEIESPPRKGASPLPQLSPRRDDRDRRNGNREMTSPRNDRRDAPPPRRAFQPSEPPRQRGDVPKAPPPNAPAKVLEPEPIPEPEPEADEEDLEKKREEKRRRREAIMAKFKAGQGAKPPISELASPKELPGSGSESVISNGLRTGANSETGTTPLLKVLGTRSITAAPTPVGSSPTLANTPLGKDFDLEKHGEEATPKVPTGREVSAADYDSTVDNDKLRKETEALAPLVKPAEAPVAEDDEWEEVEIEVEEEDEGMDMFAAFGDEEPVKKKRLVKVRQRKTANGEVITEKPKSHAAAVLEVVDNVDDFEGYYRITPGEILDDGRYQVTVTLGKGMFSAVVKATVLKAVGQERRQDVVGKEVAIKLMRSQESMYVAGRKEAQILKLLNDADPEDKKHIVRMERTFEHKGHLAIVTESLSMNLRDVIKRFGKDVGLNMRAVRAYAHQMLLSLSLMRKCNIVHADIKPDNILVSENKAVLKVCDLGTAADISEGEVTPYLVSRFYRAPEIILGMSYDTAIDMWAVGCTLFELYTGKILFPGRSNNHMLLLMMEVKGKLPHRMIKKASLGAMHFDENNNFISEEVDRITGAAVHKTMVIAKATRDLRSRLMPSSSVQVKMPEAELKQLQSFVDLLEKCLMLDPVRRISPREALLHPFVAG